MNYNYVAPPVANIKPSFFNGSFMTILLLVFIIFVALVVYYKTIGYYLEFGWNKIYAMIVGGEKVGIEIGDTIDAELKPMEPSERIPGLPGATDDSFSPLSSLSIGGPINEVYNVSRNIYTYNDASAVCSALNSELATMEQVQHAYEKGADWCNYGWIKGQMAVYPTQKETYEKLQKGPAEYRNACGQVGINGGYFDNPELRFGVNCYGVKPPKNATDELLEGGIALPPTTAEIEYEKKVQKFREQLNTLTVLPFRRGQWTQ